MILLWGIPTDSPIGTICKALDRQGEDWLLLDQANVDGFELSFEETNASSGWLQVGNQRIELEQIKSVYPRPYESARVLRAAGVTDVAVANHAARFDDAMLTWLEQTEALVVNRPSAMCSNGSKPLQSALIAEAGFAVPEILVTSDAQAAADFRHRHGKVIYKSIGGVRSRVSLLEDESLQRISGAACAIQLQEYINGTDIRVHVIGEVVFACVIQSEAVDYRYPTAVREETSIEACELPKEIAARCIELTRALGLSFAGIDLRCAADGRWICFEGNPSPGYTYYEQATGARITEALIRMLQRA